MSTGTSPINIPATASGQERRESAFLSLSPHQSAQAAISSPHAGQTGIPVTAQTASSSLSEVGSPETVEPCLLTDTLAVLDRTTSNDSSNSTNSGTAARDSLRFLKLGHAQPGDVHLGDWASNST